MADVKKIATITISVSLDDDETAVAPLVVRALREHAGRIAESINYGDGPAAEGVHDFELSEHPVRVTWKAEFRAKG